MCLVSFFEESRVMQATSALHFSLLTSSSCMSKAVTVLRMACSFSFPQISVWSVWKTGSQTSFSPAWGKKSWMWTQPQPDTISLLKHQWVNTCQEPATYCLLHMQCKNSTTVLWIGDVWCTTVKIFCYFHLFTCYLNSLAALWVRISSEVLFCPKSRVPLYRFYS